METISISVRSTNGLFVNCYKVLNIDPAFGSPAAALIPSCTKPRGSRQPFPEFRVQGLGNQKYWYSVFVTYIPSVHAMDLVR